MESANDAILRRAKFLAHNLNKHSLHSVTLLIMYDLRIPLNYIGFGYLQNAIEFTYGSKAQISAKEIYLSVGQFYSPIADSRSIEIAIRDAIAKAWASKDAEKWGSYFPDYMISRRNPPSNVEFLFAIVCFLELWQDCYEKEASYGRA